MIIYKTTNTVNGKIYVGQDSNNNPSYLGSGKLLRAAIEKYGTDAFVKETLEICETRESLNIREKYWIKELNACERGIGYNIAPGGTGGDLFTTHPDKDAWREKNRKAMLGKRNPATVEKRERVAAGMRKAWAEGRAIGRSGPRSMEERQRMSEIKLGTRPPRVICAVCVEVIDYPNFKKNHLDCCVPNRKLLATYHGQPITMTDPDGVVIGVFLSASHAAHTLNLARWDIIASLRSGELLECLKWRTASVEEYLSIYAHNATIEECLKVI